MSEDLKTLAERVAAATGPDRELDCLLFVATAESPFESYYPDCVMAILGGFRARLEIAEIHAYTASIDAAVALVERCLPGWGWTVGNLSHGGQAYLMSGPDQALVGGAASTAPLAVISALLAALLVNDASHDRNCRAAG